VELVGRYRIKERIGEGAIADVYSAHDPSIGRDLAIKVLKSELRQNQEVTARFLREATAAGALSHPGIVTIFDVGEVDGFPYIAMELIDGQPLDEVLQQYGKLELNHALRIGHQLAAALDYAHCLGVIHRDIKPSNIMLCENGNRAKILDFGIARIGEPDRVRAELNLLRTQVGQLLGTPRYMSPEQALGLDVDHRSDLFSLGAVLYEILTGQPAFKGNTLATIAVQITREHPDPLKSFSATCTAGLQLIIDKLLAKQPDKRFARGADVAQALREEHQAIFSEPARRAAPSLQLRLSLLIGGLTAVALLLSISAVLSRQYAAMERMAVTSGASIASFVANNVALRAVDNASLPEGEQDWLPVQAFVVVAAQDPNVEDIIVTDARGIVRGSKHANRIGRRHLPSTAGSLVEQGGGGRIISTGDESFRVQRDVSYAGAKVGLVELTVAKKELNAAAAASRNLLIALGFVVLLVVMAGGYAITRQLAMPISRLKAALIDAAAGRREFRISHSRTDEFGELYDRFNDLIAAIETDASTPEQSAANAAALNATRVEPAPVAEQAAAVVAARRMSA
jgi:serine/threonine protein kinase